MAQQQHPGLLALQDTIAKVLQHPVFGPQLALGIKQALVNASQGIGGGIGGNIANRLVQGPRLAQQLVNGVQDGMALRTDAGGINTNPATQNYLGNGQPQFGNQNPASTMFQQTNPQSVTNTPPSMIPGGSAMPAAPSLGAYLNQISNFQQPVQWGNQNPGSMMYQQTNPNSVTNTPRR